MGIRESGGLWKFSRGWISRIWLLREGKEDNGIVGSVDAFVCVGDTKGDFLPWNLGVLVRRRMLRLGRV